MEQQAEHLTRPIVPALDDILGKPLKVLDDGFVRVVDYMGSDESIVQAARVSYGKGTKKVNEDRGLIRYLLRHAHTTPFEMCEIKLHVRVPMDCWRQWIRHRTANVNEYSTRYSLAIDASQRTPPEEWRLQSKDNKQGSEGFASNDLGKKLSEQEWELQNLARNVYNERVQLGIAREQARKDLPLSTYTEAYWKVDLHNLFHFLALRMDAHAQYEIRMYADTIGNEIVGKWVPLAWEAFLDYRLKGSSLSNIEMGIIRAINSGNPKTAIDIAVNAGILPPPGQERKRNREREDLETKLQSLGIDVPWK
ncbi:MAG: FAD-dependent thymidylate synthase [Ignavibacteriales bacterium]|nr:FAD-dependent thymidylate synthase [Ignavibacteriales bacterium]